MEKPVIVIPELSISQKLMLNDEKNQ